MSFLAAKEKEGNTALGAAVAPEEECRLEASVELDDSREETKLPLLGEVEDIPESTFDLVDLVEEVEDALLFLLLRS